MQRTVLSLLAVFSVTLLIAQAGEQQLKENAQQLFEDGKYAEAMPLYGQLVGLYPTNSVYNFKYGTCIIYGEADKEKAVGFLKFATQDPSISNAAWYFYGKALHLNYRFNDALTAYRKFEGKASKKELLAHPVASEIKSARNGLGLLSELKDITVLDKLDVSEEEFFRYFDLSDIGGKILVTPEELKTSLDRKRGSSSLVHYPENSDAIYYSSYGRDGKTGKDIYRTYLLPDGTFAEPKKLAGYVNSDQDEDYAYMHPDGRTFFFCSKGHNSMGGYDVFKSVYDANNDIFGPAQNLDFAINTPDDDIFYIVDSIFDLAYFASARSSEQGKIHVYKVKNERTPINLSIIKGEFLSEITPDDKRATITVEDALTRERIGEYKTDENDGSYVIVLPRGGKYRMIVEAEQSNKTHVGVVDIPRKDQVHAFKQEISLVTRSGQEKLVIRNLFDEAVDDDLIALALAEIKRRAELDVNFMPDVSDATPIEKTVEDASLDAGFSGNLSNDDIVNMAFEDASAMEREAKLLNDRADFAFVLANDKVTEAKTLVREADSKVKMADAAEDHSEKESLMTEAAQARTASERTNQEARVAFELAANLEVAHAEKAEDAAIAMVYARELEAAINSDSYEEAFEKLSDQKEKLEATSGPNARKMDIYEAARQKAMDKQDEADKAMVRAIGVREEEKELRNHLTRAHIQLEGTSSKSKKEEYQAEIDVLEADVELVQKDIDRAFDRAAQIQEQADLLDAQAQLYFAISSDSEGSEPAEAIVLSDQQKQQIRRDIAANDEQINAIEIDELIVAETGVVNPNSNESDVRTEVMEESSASSDRESTASLDNRETEISGSDQKGMVVAGGVVTGTMLGTRSSEENAGRLEEELEATESIEDVVEKEAQQKKVNEDWVVILDADIDQLNTEAELETDPNRQQEILRQADELADLKARKQLAINESEGILAAYSINVNSGARSTDLQDAELIDQLVPDHQSEWEKVANTNLNEVEKLRAWAALDLEVVDKAQDEIANTLALLSESEDEGPVLETIAELRALDKRMRSEAIELVRRADISATALMASNSESTPNTEALADNGQGTDGNWSDVNVSARNYVVRSEHEDIYASNIEFRSDEAAKANESSADDRVEVAELTAEIEALEVAMEDMQDGDLRQKAERRIFKMRDDQLMLNANIGQRSSYQNKEEFAYNEDSLKTLLARVESEMQVEEFDPSMSFIYAQEDRATTKFNEAKELRKQAEREDDMVEKDLMFREAYSLETWGLQDLDRAITATSYVLSEEYVSGKELSYEEMEESLFGVTLSAASTQVQNTGTHANATNNDLAQNTIQENKGTGELKQNEENNNEDLAALNDQDAGAGLEVDGLEIDEDASMVSGSEENTGTQVEQANSDRDVDPTGNSAESQNGDNAKTEGVVPEIIAGDVSTGLISNQDFGNGSTNEVDNDARSSENEPFEVPDERNVGENEIDQQPTTDITGTETEVLALTEKDIQADYLNTGTPEAKIERTGNVVRIGSGLIITGDPKEEQEEFVYQPLPQDNTPLPSKEEFERSDQLEDESLMLISEAQVLRDSSYTVKKKEREPLIQQAVAMEEKARDLLNESERTFRKASEMEAEESIYKQNAVFEHGLEQNYVLNAQEVEDVSSDEVKHYYFELKVKARNAESAAIVNYMAEEHTREEAQKKVDQSRDLLFVVDSITNEDVRADFVERAGSLNEEAIVLTDRADSLKKEARRNESIIVHNNKKAQEHIAGLDETTANDIVALEQSSAREPAYRLALAGEEEIGGDRVIIDRVETADASSITISRPVRTPATSEAPTSSATAFIDPAGYSIPETLVADIFTTNATVNYNESKPIPVDPPMPEGLVFKVQVGAFRNAIPQNLYEGFAPVMGEKLNSGITRYTAGLFTSYSTAGFAKELIRDLGYSDAFVVAFLNGERIPLGQAIAAQSEEQLAATPITPDAESNRPDYNLLDTQSSTVDVQEDQGVEISFDQEETELLSEYPTTSEELLNEFQPATEADEYYNDPNAAEAEQVETIQGLFYTVQVGVYSKPVTSSAIFNIAPLNSQRTESGLIRYTTGQFTDLNAARIKKNEIVLVGVDDAFITAYLNGQRIPMNEAAALIQKFGPAIFSAP